MSWSIDTDSMLGELDTAIQAAVNDKILMFCSSIDQGSSARDNTYPGKVPGCIKIGASSGTGEKLTWVSETSSDFLLPGENVQPTEAHYWSRLKSGPYGSSISTALVAGLAGVLLYCDRLVAAGWDSETRISGGGSEGGCTSFSRDKEVDALRQMNEMKKAFTNLSRGTEKGKLPQVWDHFPDPDELVWNPRDEDKSGKTKKTLEGLLETVKAGTRKAKWG